MLRLLLNNNGLYEDGCQAICKMMEDNCYITHLDLSCNQMRAVGSMAAQKMLKNNNTLSDLTCSGEPLVPQPVQAHIEWFHIFVM